MPVDQDWTEDEASLLQPPEGATDSASVEPQSSGPTPSSDAPGSDEEPLGEHGAGESESEEPEPIPEFDPRVRQDFEGLLYLGYLTDAFTAYGHRFVIRTLSVGEVLEVGLLHKPYQGTLADMKAYQALLVAACVESVDGRPLPIPITDSPADTALLNRFEYVQRSWFPPVLNGIYDRYLLLEDRVEKVLEAMGNPAG